MGFDIEAFINALHRRQIYRKLDLALFVPIVIFNLLLFVKTLRAEKIRRDPWRWLVLYASLGMVAHHCFDLPRKMKRRGPPIIAKIAHLYWLVKRVGLTLVITERFHAFRLDKGREGGVDKKAAIILMVFFWLFCLLASVLYVVYHWSWIHYAIQVWATLTTIIVFIGTLVLNCRKTSNDYVKNSIFRPALALSCMGFLCHGLSFGYGLFLTHVIQENTLYYDVPLAWTLSQTYDVAFPIVWMASWTRNKEISWDCGKADEENEEENYDEVKNENQIPPNDIEK